MPLFICDNCGGRDNTATGWYWSRRKNTEYFGQDYPDGQGYCAKCTPAFSIQTLKKHEESGEPLPDESILMGGYEERDGKLYCVWHNHFEFKIPDAQEVTELIHGNHIQYTDKLVEVLGSKQAVEDAFAECERRRELERQEYMARHEAEMRERRACTNSPSSKVTVKTNKPKKRPGKRGRP